MTDVENLSLNVKKFIYDHFESYAHMYDVLMDHGLDIGSPANIGHWASRGSIPSAKLIAIAVIIETELGESVNWLEYVEKGGEKWNMKVKSPPKNSDWLEWTQVPQEH